MTSISIVIPTLNEEERIGRLVHHLRSMPDQMHLEEILVCDGGSRDRTRALAGEAGAQVLRSPEKGRASQMNYAAAQAKGEVLYFVHADVLPPRTCLADIVHALQNGHQMGCFSFDFDSPSWLLKVNAYLTQFDSLTSGGGDQTFFIPKQLFEELGCFDERLPIMEDFDFVWRAKKKYSLHLVKTRALVSARKYEKNNYFKVQLVNGITLTLFRRGVCPFKLAKWYKRVLKL